jgi:hypothetical protein
MRRYVRNCPVTRQNMPSYPGAAFAGYRGRARGSTVLKRLSAWAPLFALVLIAAGVVIGCTKGRGASTPNLTRYTFGDRGPGVGDIRSHLPAALVSDRWLILAYGLVLLACAGFYRARASSRFGCLIANFVLAAVVVAVLADVLEDVFLAMTLTRKPEPAWLTSATTAAAIGKFCTIAVAAFGPVASAGIVLRGVTGVYYRAWAWHRSHGKSLGRTLSPRNVIQWIGFRRAGEAQPKPWWDAMLAPDDLPELKETDQAAERSGQTGLSDNERGWRRAYNVPGLTAILRDRTEPLRALCLSGGGVRSACVAMGAMQVFSRPVGTKDNAEPPRRDLHDAATLLDGLDYVISVSGGGYAAGARLLGVQPEPVEPGSHRSENTAQPPGNPPSVAPVSARFEEGSVEFDHIRRGSSYIADSPLDMVRALGQVLRNLLASLATILIVPVIAGWGLGWLLARIPIAAFPPVPAEQPGAAPNAHGRAYTETELKWWFDDYFMSLVAHPAAYWALGLLAATAVSLTMIALVIEWVSASRCGESLRAWVSGLARAIGGLALVVFTLTIAVPGLMRLCWWVSAHTPASPGSAFTALSGVVGLNYVAALIAMVWRDKNKLAPRSGSQLSPGLLKRLLPPGVVSLLLILGTLAVLLLVWLALLGSFAAGVFHYSTKSGFGKDLTDVPYGIWWVCGLAAAALFIGFADVTSLSLHPFYRRRLAHTFAVRRLPIVGGGNTAVRYPDNEATWLHHYGRVTKGPKFVFACSATVTGPEKPAPGLNAVSYVLSAEHVGGPELGWFHTRELLEVSPPRIRRDLTVEAAVAVSGAAFASAMGRQDNGIEKLLAISGARLGTWLPNPHFVRLLCNDDGCHRSDPDDPPRVLPKSLPTIRGAGYLYREILGINNKDARLVQITDGGHYDNSGLVEALRRRCRLIIVIDGGGDRPPLPTGLTDALRLAKYELGVDIALKRRGKYSLENIAPGSGTQFAKDNALAGLNPRITRGAVVRGEITYPAAAGLENSSGTLVFVKAVVSQDCPYWLLSYAASSEIFPHDPTSDQWFNEGQFAAYTELGRVIAKEAVECIEQSTPPLWG